MIPSQSAAPKSNTLLHILALSLFTLLVCGPVLLYGLPDWGNDAIEHARRVKHFSNQFWSGVLYPRWLSDTNAGLGCPVFFIYSPLPTYVAALFYPVVQSIDPHGFYSIGLLAIVSILVSGLGVYFWCRRIAGTTPALFAALVYMIVPYHLAVNVYTRGAMGELWAQAALPFILLSVDAILDRKRWGVVALIISYSLLVYSHLPTTVCFSLVPLAAAFFLSEPGQKLRVLLRVAVGMTIGMCLGAAYVLPAQFEGKYMSLGGSNTGEFYYRRWWLTQIQPLFDARTRLLLLTLVTIGFVAGAAWLCYRYLPANATRERRFLTFLLGASAVTLFLTTQLSAPIWTLFPLLQGLPFPTRFLQTFNILVPGVAALAFPFFRSSRSRIVPGFMVLMLFAWVAGDIWAASKAYSVWRPFATDQAQYYEKLHYYQREYPAYWPKWSQAGKVSNFPEFEEQISRNPPRSLRLTSAQGQPVGAASVVAWNPREVILAIQAPEPAHLTVIHFYYPGWHGHIDDPATDIAVIPTEPDGFLKMDVPKGNYRLRLVLGKEPPEQIGDFLSLAAFLVTAGLAIWAAFGARSR